MTALEWLANLGPKLISRRDKIARWTRYFDGNQDMPVGPQQHRDAYRAFQKKARTNLCKLAVESVVHRTQVIGYSSGEAEDRTNNDVWQLWQNARLDSRQSELYRKALVSGAAYLSISVDPNRDGRPLATIESAHNMIIAYDPGDPTLRLAALRLWHDEYENRWKATVYLPGERYAYQTKNRHSVDDPLSMLKWDSDAWVQRLEPAVSFDEVPVVEFRNGEQGQAEFDVAIDIQDRVNLTLLNRMTAERYAAFRKQYLLNYEADYDEITGLPINPFKSAADSLFIVPPAGPGMPEPKFGDLQQTDTANMLRAVEADMSAFAAVSITPIYYLPGDLINISAEGIAALDAGHTAKIREKQGSWSESHEEALSMMAKTAGINRDLNAAEIVWARPENFDLSSQGDYVSKYAGAGYPLPVIEERLGSSPQQINKLRAELAAQAAREALLRSAEGDDTGGGSRGRQRGSQGQEGASERP